MGKLLHWKGFKSVFFFSFDFVDTPQLELLESGLALISVNYPRNVCFSILLNQWLALTVLWATGPCCLDGACVVTWEWYDGTSSFSFRRKSTADFISWFILVARCSFLSKVSSMIRKRASFCVCLFCNCEILILLFFSRIHSFQIHWENICLPKTVFSTWITELSFQSFIPKSHSLSRYPKVVSIQKLIFRYITL